MPASPARWLAGGTRPDWTATVVVANRSDSGDERPLDELDDGELVRACVAGRTEAFDVIVARHQRAIYQLCVRFSRRPEDAADLTQDVFLRAYRGLRRFRGESRLATWLYRIGVNVCVNHAAARRSAEASLEDAPEPAGAAPDPGWSLEHGERRAQVRAAVARLPPKQRAALILRVYHDLSHQEIASVLRTSVGAVKANVFHALGNLRKALAERPG